jgi:PAS domain S-box-containing protein
VPGTGQIDPPQAAADVHRRTAEADAREADSLARLLLETAEGCALFAVTPEGHVCLWSRAAECLTGWTSHDILGRSLTVLHPREGDAPPDAELRRAEAQGRSEEVGWWQRRDGSRFQAEESFTALCNEEGRLLGFAVCLSPVEGSRAIERELQLQREREARRRATAAEQRGNDLLERIADAFLALDRQWRFTYVNRKTEEMAQRGPGQLLGRSIWEEFPMLREMGMEAELRRAMAEQRPLHFEQYLPRSRAWLAVHAYPSEEGLSVFLRDISERKQAEEERRESERFLKATLDALSAHLAILDEAGRILATNAVWRRFCQDNAGTPERTGVGVSYLEVCDRAAAAGNESGAEVARGLREVLSGARASFALEYPCHSPTERRWFALRATRFTGPGPTRVVVAHERITERMLALEALRQSEARFRAIFEHAGIGIVVLDAGGHLLEANRALRMMMGYAEEELLGRLPHEFAWPEDQTEEDTRLFEETLAGRRERYQLERRFRRKDGQLIWCRFTLTPLCAEDGLPLYAVGMVEDITARKREHATALRLGREEAARAEAEATRERIAIILESITDPFLALDREGRFTFLNRRAAEVLGVPREALLGRRWEEALPRLGDTRLAREIARTTASREPVSFEEFLSPLHACFEAHLSPSGEGLSVYLRDISERKRVEDAQHFLAEASRVLVSSLEYEPLLRSLVRLVVPRMADYCVVFLSEGEELRAVAMAHRDPTQEPLMEGLERLRFKTAPARMGLQHVVHTGHSELIPLVTPEWLRAAELDPELLRVVEVLGPRSLMLVPLVARGRILGVMTLGAQEPGRYGDFELSIAEDLAGRAALAIDNARLYRESQLASRMRDEVLAIVSHDLRNPLNTIQLSAGLLRQKLCPSEGMPGHKQVDIIERSSQRAVRLIGDLLEVGKIQAGRLKVERGPQEARRLVLEAAELHKGLAEARGLRLTCDLPRALPEVLADRERVQQVLSNLIGNAIKATAAGGCITLGGRVHAEGVRLWVEDTGKGIPAEHLPRLFDWLWQPQGTKEGAGLGLYISKGIIEAHGGRIWVESQPGRGSTFSFTLPRTPGRPAR